MKLKNLFVISALSLIVTGCDIKLYKPSDENIIQNGTSTNIDESQINVIYESNYTGTIKYASDDQSKLAKEEIYRQNVTSTVYIIASDLENSYLGSGVFFSEDKENDGYAYLFTNAHVVKDALNIEIVYSNYKRDKAAVVGYHLLEDVAVLKVRKNDNYTIATLQTSDKLIMASEIVTIGTPISTDYSFTSTSGIISKINSTLTSSLDQSYYLSLIQIDATLNQGNSGGPLFDMYGNLIGLNTMKLAYDSSYTQVDDFNFAIPIDRAVFIANRIFNNKPYNRGKIGITITDIVDLSLSQREEYNLTLEYGLYVIEGNGQDANSINSSDVIVKINGIAFTTQIEFQKELFKFSKGENINLEVYRNSQYKTITITLK